MAQRLLKREALDTIDTIAAGGALERAVGRVFDDLTGAVGADGIDALLERAIRQTEKDHPAVAAMRRMDGAGTRLDIRAAIEAHGMHATHAGLEALFTALVDTLSALIGADMTRYLLHLGDS
jgi:hypothetical protein